MGNENKDLLYVIFERQLPTFLAEEVEQHKFIDDIVDEYFSHISGFKDTFILDNHLLEIRDDLCSEVLDMLRKKTYGQISLNSSHSSAYQLPEEYSWQSKRKPT